MLENRDQLQPDAQTTNETTANAGAARVASRKGWADFDSTDQTHSQQAQFSVNRHICYPRLNWEMCILLMLASFAAHVVLIVSAGTSSADASHINTVSPRSIPIIDISPLVSPTSTLVERQLVANQINQACTDIGFFAITTGCNAYYVIFSYIVETRITLFKPKRNHTSRRS